MKSSGHDATSPYRCSSPLQADLQKRLSEKTSYRQVTLEVPRSPNYNEEYMSTSPLVSKLEIAGPKTEQAFEDTITEQEPDQESSVTPTTFRRVKLRSADPAIKYKKQVVALPSVEKREKEDSHREHDYLAKVKGKKNSFSDAFEASLVALVNNRRGSVLTSVKGGLRLDGFDQEKRKCLQGSKVVPFPLQPESNNDRKLLLKA